jgi:ankyrin repeat protein
MMEIVTFIRKFHDNWIATRKKTISLLFAWFAPEIEALDPLLFTSCISILTEVVNFSNTHVAFSHFHHHFESHRLNNWQKLRSRRDDNRDPSRNITWLLRHDDASGLRQIIEQSGFPFSRRVLPDIHVPCPLVQNRPSLLMYAAVYNSIQCFQYLQINGGDKFVSKDDKYRTLSDFAVAGGNLMIVRFSENMKCNFDSGLQIAMTYQHGAIFTHLMKTHGVELNQPDRFGKMVITSAAAANNITGLLFCLNHQISIDSQEGFGWTPLHCAAERGAFEICYIILNIEGIEANPRDVWGVTPLHLATDRLKVDIVEYFLKAKMVNVNSVNCDGQTAFHIAADSDCVEIIEPFLASNRIDVNIQDEKGRTALHIAIRRGNIAIISKILHRPDIKIELRTKSGKTAFDIVQKKKNQSVLALWAEYENVRTEKCSVA